MRTAEQRTRTPLESIAARPWLRRRRAVVALGLAGGLAVAAAWQLAGGSDPAAEDRPTTAWRGALLTADGRGLLLAYPKGCADGPDRVVVSEDAATVRVGIVQRPPRWGGCASSYLSTTIEARLPEPLGGRRLVDAHTGIEHQPVDAAGVLRPTFLPRGVPLTPAGEGPTTEAGPSGWRRSYGPAGGLTGVAIEQAPASAALRPAGFRPVATVSVGGRPALLSTRRDGGGEYLLRWTVGGWTRQVSVGPVRPAEVRSMAAELVRVAESLR